MSNFLFTFEQAAMHVVIFLNRHIGHFVELLSHENPKELSNLTGSNLKIWLDTLRMSTQINLQATSIKPVTFKI